MRADACCIQYKKSVCKERMYMCKHIHKQTKTQQQKATQKNDNHKNKQTYKKRPKNKNNKITEKTKNNKKRKATAYTLTSTLLLHDPHGLLLFHFLELLLGQPLLLLLGLMQRALTLLGLAAFLLGGLERLFHLRLSLRGVLGLVFGTDHQPLLSLCEQSASDCYCYNLVICVNKIRE